MYYKIKVYKIEDKVDKSIFLIPKMNDERRKFEYVDDIIVEEKYDKLQNYTSYKEIYTDYELNILSQDDILDNNILKTKSVNYRKLRDEKIIFFAFEENIKEKEDVTVLELDKYFKKFFEGNYKKLYDEFFDYNNSYVKRKVK